MRLGEDRARENKQQHILKYHGVAPNPQTVAIPLALRGAASDSMRTCSFVVRPGHLQMEFSDAIVLSLAIIRKPSAVQALYQYTGVVVECVTNTVEFSNREMVRGLRRA